MFGPEKTVVMDMTGRSAHVERFSLEEKPPIAAPAATGTSFACASFTKPCQPIEIAVRQAETSSQQPTKFGVRMNRDEVFHVSIFAE